MQTSIKKCPEKIGAEIINLFCTEDSVACVAETGNNVAMLIKVIVECCAVNVNIGMSLLKSVKSLGSSDDAHELDGTGVFSFDK